MEPLRDKFVIFFLDDILIFAQNFNEMLCRLEEVLKLLRSARLTIKLSKCEFAKRKIECEYFGYVISGDGIEPGTRKLDAIKHFPRPIDLHGVRRYLGMASFFRRFASITEPLTRLTKKRQPFIWEAEQETAFNEIKTILTSRPVLHIYNPKVEITELHRCKRNWFSIK